MDRDKADDNTLAFPVLAIFRGLYQRVAAKLGVDPSYVSRVARGERKSEVVLAALQEEMEVIREHLNHQLRDGKGPDGDLQNGQVNGGQVVNGKRPDAKLAKGTAAKGTQRVSSNGRDAKAAD